MLQFNRGLGNRDVAALAAHMTEDHVFIDSGGEVHSGKQTMVQAWTAFFAC